MATTYDYKCSENPEHLYSESRGMNEEQKQTTCAEKGCNGRLVRVFSAPKINFKGGGYGTNKDWV
jgi:predicted nucleic acid-binding Zn ribbon protein